MLKYTMKIAVMLLLLATNVALPVNYYVSTTGNDDLEGTTEETAWASIDNGDQKGILLPGDTVNILNGTYTITSKIDLTSNGAPHAPIVYLNYEDKAVVLDADSAGLVIIESNGNHVVIKGLQLQHTSDQGIHVKGDSTRIIGCYVHHTGNEGYRNDGNYNLFLRNVAANCGEEGFKNVGGEEGDKDGGGADFAIYHHNVAYSCLKAGFDLNFNNSRVINSISVLNDTGIKGGSNNLCAYNNVWGNLMEDYDGGVTDSAGGMSDNPGFINPVLNNFGLKGNSSVIDKGMYLGYSYLGTAPDMGISEFVPVNLPPKISNISAKTVYQGESLNFEVSATDANGTIPSLSAENLPANAGFIDNADGTGMFDFNPDYSQSGVYEVLFIASDGELADSEYVEITVNLDPISYIVVSPDSAIISADSTLQYTVTGFSASAQPRDPGNITWELTEDIGTIDSEGLFSAEMTGTTRVVAISDLGPVDTSAYLEVVAGQLDSIVISPQIDTLSADSSVQFSVSGFDADGNDVVAMGNLTWEVIRGIGTIDNSGLFEATKADYGYIKVTSDLGPTSTSEKIVVIPGRAVYLNVLPEENLAEQGSSTQYSAKAYDVDSNFVSDTSSFVTWIVTDPSGSITDDGLYTAGSDPSPPVYHVIADLASIRDSGQVTVISDGSLDYIQIEWLDGTPVEDSSFTTDDDSLKIYCRGYDSDDNLLGNIPVTWNLQSSEPIGLLLENSTYYTRLNLDTPGNGRITAQYSADIVDTSGLITCQTGNATKIVISPDTITVSADSTIQFAADAYDSDGNLTGPVAIDSWNVIGDIGQISSIGIFNPDSVGIGQITCRSGILEDTSGTITVVAGVLSRLEISPDSLELTPGSGYAFEISGMDQDGNDTETGGLAWEVIGEIGTIDNSGLFTAINEGSGRIAVTSSINGIADTNEIVSVISANLEMLVITPDTASLMTNESLQFQAFGFDAGYQPINTGELTWEVIGDIGTIDSEGNFVANAKGVCKIAVSSSINSLADTTNLIVVEVPTISELPLGNQIIMPNQSLAPVLAFKISNAFEETKYLSEISLRSACRGTGNSSQLLSNIASLAVHQDLNNNSMLDQGDLTVGTTSQIGNLVNIVLDPVAIPQASSAKFFISLRTSLYPHDGDSLDFYMLTASDLSFTSGTVLAGPDSVNSLGYCIVDGMSSEQVQIISSGNRSVNPESGIAKCLTLDLPRNGYEADTLNIISLFNDGNATTMDIDSFMLFGDDGDGSWENASSEIYYGKITFTGHHWSLSGINVPLTAQNNRFYVCAALSDYPTDGRKIALGIPKRGIEMASENDGPLDAPVNPVDTITILASSALTFASADLPAAELVPGAHSMPLTVIEIGNGTTMDVQLDSLRIRLYASDPDGAQQAELNSQIDSVILWLNNDDDPGTRTSADSIIDRRAFSGSSILFDTRGLTLSASGGSAELFVTSVLDPYLSKNGNTINFGLNDSIDIYIDQSVEIAGSFPISNPEAHTINAFPSGAVEIHPVEGQNLFGGQKNQIFLDFSLPGDGYRDAQLNTLRVINRGTTNSNQALGIVRLWEDVDFNGLTANDIYLGQLYNNNGYWTVNDLRHSFERANNRFIVSADIANTEFAGGTLRFEIPVGGVEFAGGTTGPDDEPAGNPESHFLLPANRVTAISIPQELIIARPGSKNVQILTFALYNGYLENEHTLRSIRFLNKTSTISDDGYADYELGQVSLYIDKNGNRSFDDDSLLAVGYFSNGALTLNGINAELLPEELAYFFVLSDLPLNLIDNDTLAISIESTSDFIFEQTVNLNGDLPLMRGGKVVLDGSVSEQYQQYGLSNRTLSPGDINVCLFAFKPAINGNLDDLLHEITLENRGDADQNDIKSLELWTDSNGDGLFQEGDLYQGEFLFTDPGWTYSGMGLTINGNSPALFVVADISTTAATGRSIQLKLPLNGCQYTSGNDGPLDDAVIAEQIFLISASGLRISFEALNSEYTVGEKFCTIATITNLTQDAVQDIKCDISLFDNSGALAGDSSYLGPVTIAPGESEEFYHCYTAVKSGSVHWEIQAYSLVGPDSTGLLISDTVLIQSIPQDLKINLISSIPASVIRGQTHVYPLSISYNYPDGEDNSAPLRLDSLRIRVTDGSGNPRIADETFSRMVLSSGYSNLAVLEDLAAESSVLIEFDTPDVMYPGEKRALSLMVDIDSSAETGDFRVLIENPGHIAFVEYNTGLPITFDESVQFPLQTASCRIDNPSRYMAVSYVPALGEYINYGQNDVSFLNLILRHPGEAQSSQIQLTGLSFEFVNSLGESMPVYEFLDEIKVLRQDMLIGYLDNFSLMNDSVWIQLNAPPVLSPGEIDTISLKCSMHDNVAFEEIGLRINDSTAFTFRDVSSGLQLSAVSDKDSLSADEIFPMFSGLASFKQPAEAVEICINPALQSSVVGGADSVALFDILLGYPVSGQYSSINISSIEISVLDTLERALDPSRVFNRIGYRLQENPVEYQSYVRLHEGRAVFDFNSNAIVLAPDEQLNLRLVADLESDAPYDHFMVVIQGWNHIKAVDATDTTHEPDYLDFGSCNMVFPCVSGAAQIFLPAAKPSLNISDQPVQIGYPGQSGVTLFSAEIDYHSTGFVGDLLLLGVNGEVRQRTQNGLEYVRDKTIFDRIKLFINDSLIAGDSILTDGILDLEPISDYIISRDNEYELSLVADISPEADLGNYTLRFIDSTFLPFADKNLNTEIFANIASRSYPITGAELSLDEASLEGSFTNYPNPFNPNMDKFTRIAFSLDQDARIDIEIFTITGERIRVLAENSLRSAGTYTDDQWNGLNDLNLMVLPGTYFCRITARYDSGRTETLRRKIAVIR